MYFIVIYVLLYVYTAPASEAAAYGSITNEDNRLYHHHHQKQQQQQQPLPTSLPSPASSSAVAGKLGCL
jgi:hypothetical protein